MGSTTVSVVPASTVLRRTKTCGDFFWRMAAPISLATCSMWLRSSLPFFKLGVPTQTNETSEFSTAAVASVVAFKRPARFASATISLMRASMIGVRPESIISTLARLTSTPMTLWPMEAKQAADTEPTYPNPKMLTDKPKRILLAIVFLGPLRGTRNYINPLLSDSKSRSIGLLEVLRLTEQHYCFQYVTEYT